MSLDPDRTPVVVAAGQAESRDLSLGPIELAVRAAREALDAAPSLERAVERLTVINILSSRAGPAPARAVASSVGLSRAVHETTVVGGNMPQALVERAAGDIAAGRLSATLILGAEAVRSGRLRPAGEASEPGGGRTEAPADPVVGIERRDLSEEEAMVGLAIPVFVYPMFESVLASRAGRTPAEQRRFLGRLLAPFTEVAAGHPHAWFPQRRTPEELSEVRPDNRLVAEPYVKMMTSFLGGAQAAGVVVTSLSLARRLGLDDGAMFVWSGATANDVWYPIARPDLGRSAGLEAAAAGALRAAGIGVDDVSLFDLYSCFPSALEIAAAELGLGLDPDRPEEIRRLTVTGGLPYFGGPGNNYSTHAIATMLERLRSGSQPAGGIDVRIGLVTGVGWYLTKHSVGVYASAPPPVPYATSDTAEAQEAIDATAVPFLRGGAQVSALAVVDASTVLYDREGHPTAAPVIATLPDGRRVAAAAAEGVIEEVAGTFLVGAKIHVERGAGKLAAPAYTVVEAASPGRRSAEEPAASTR